MWLDNGVVWCGVVWCVGGHISMLCGCHINTWLASIPGLSEALWRRLVHEEVWHKYPQIELISHMQQWSILQVTKPNQGTHVVPPLIHNYITCIFWLLLIPPPPPHTHTHPHRLLHHSDGSVCSQECDSEGGPCLVCQTPTQQGCKGQHIRQMREYIYYTIIQFPLRVRNILIAI